VPGAIDATTAAQVRSGVQGGEDVCVTAAVGNVNLDGLTSSTVRHVGTSPTGSMGAIHMDHSSRITLRARFRSIKFEGSDFITIEQSIIGGTSSNRVSDVLIFIPQRSDDVTIRDNDIGWTTADNSGNTGFGIRAYNDSARLRIERNYIHHIAADAIQLGMRGPDTVVDRNEVAYAARPVTSNEHSDDLQITGNGPNMRVTNNYFHHCGWFTAIGPTTGCNSMAIHAGTSNALLFENNMEAYALGLPFIGDLGTGGCVRSNATFRRNTWFNNGTQFTGGPDLVYAHCGGSNNLWERNLVNATFFNTYGFPASGTTARDNLVGAYTIDPATGNCTAAACNPSGQEPIGYRKPSGVHW
jgi:Right handed beta helix region